MPALPARGRVVARAPRRVCRRRGDAGCPRRLRQSAPPTRRTKAEPGLDRPTARFAPRGATVVAMGNGSAVRGHHRARNAAAIGPRGAGAVPHAGRKQRRCADHRNSRGRLRVGNHRSGSTPHLAQRGRAHRGRPDPGECLRARRSLRIDRTGSAGHPGRARRGAGRTPRPSEHPMSAIRRSLLALLCLCAFACAQMEGRTATPADGGSLERQVLVMLRLPAPHFRPDVNYAGSFDWRVGGDGRRRIAERLANQYGIRVIDGWPMPALGVDCFVMEAAGDGPLAPIVDKLSLDPRVESAQSMQLFRVLAHNDPLYPLQPSAKAWHLDELHRITTGRRIRVAEIDTGVEVDHPDLRGRVAVARNFVDGRGNLAEMHGTAVAGIIAARADDGLGIAGIAPEARLLALRACWPAATSGEIAFCSSFTLAKALQFALEEKAQVINLSLGGPRDRLLERLLDTALSRGVTIVGAANPDVGNGGFPAS